MDKNRIKVQTFMELIGPVSGDPRRPRLCPQDAGRDERAQAGIDVRSVLPVTKAVVASRLNPTPEHFSRIMADFRTRKMISVRGREVSILDNGALRRYAG